METGGNFTDGYEELLTHAASLSFDYLRRVGERRVGISQEAIDALSNLS
jgi:hypothetical protein